MVADFVNSHLIEDDSGQWQGCMVKDSYPIHCSD